MPTVDVTVSNGDTHAIGNPSFRRGHGFMCGFTLVADRRMESPQVFGKIIVYS
jgi:hypothetical protein